MFIIEINNNPIGVFDSGLGGITVVKEIIKILPKENIIYFGDNKRAPYGVKSTNTIYNYSKEIINFLLKKNVKIIVIACNTISAVSYNKLSKNFNIPIIEIITSGVESCIKTTKNNKIGIIATKATILSNEYENKIKNLNKNIEVYSKACNLFVPIIEKGFQNNIITKIICNIYLKSFSNIDIDTLILGCTHYPILYKDIKKILGNVNIINPALLLSLKIKQYLTDKNLLNNRNNKIYKFYTTGNINKFKNISSKMLNENFNVYKAVL